MVLKDLLRLTPLGRDAGKTFCIGFPKTGTTSLGVALESLGFTLGDQASGEMLLEDWSRLDFRSTIRLCRTADAFQDIPFALPNTYRALDAAFPESRFILTVRDSPQQWFDSLVRFHTKIVGLGRTPTAADLKAFSYRYEGWLWRTHELVFDADESSLYARDLYVDKYEAHNRAVLDYFNGRKDSLLVLNLADADAMERLCRFLGVEAPDASMPHLNKSRPEASEGVAPPRLERASRR